MNRTLKEATVRRYHYDSHDQLRQHLGAFLDAYNFGKSLKTHLGLPVGWSVDFLSIPYPASHQGSCGIDAYIITPDVTRTLGAPPRTAVGRVRVA